MGNAIDEVPYDTIAHMVELNELERQSRHLIEASRRYDWTPMRACICNVFRSAWAQGLTTNQIIQWVEIQHGGDPCDPDLDRGAVLRELRKMREDGTLRQRSERGVTLHEVNLS